MTDEELVARATANTLRAIAHILVMKDNESEENGNQRFWTGGNKGLDKWLLEMAAAEEQNAKLRACQCE